MASAPAVSLPPGSKYNTVRHVDDVPLADAGFGKGNKVGAPLPRATATAELVVPKSMPTYKGSDTLFHNRQRSSWPFDRSEKVVAFVVDNDERRKVDNIDLPHRFHA